MSFSALDRSVNIERLTTESFDLLVIGGGITGCGIALDAASRGLKTALIEKSDFAYGTSSRSTKLIHGGLRYLKQLEFGLVKEVGSERAIVHRLAPHLVIPEKMLLPLTDRSLGETLTSVGLKVYDWLAGVKREDRRKMLTRQQTLRQEPLLKGDRLKGGALYAEYRTDDARLTIEIAKTAVRHGALLLNYLKAVDFVYANGKVAGVRARDEFTNSEIEIKSKVVVNAAGPWVDELRKLNHSMKEKQLHLTKGVHIVVPFEKLPVRQSIYFDVEDGRMIFAIPRGRATYVGTTDTNYLGNLDEVHASKEDATYLINAVNQAFESVSLRVEDIESSWAGLRPLIHEEGKSASELSRKDEIFESDTGLVSIAGGKLTGYRKMAERTVDLVVDEYLDLDVRDCTTHKIKLTEPHFSNYDEVKEYVVQLKKKLDDLDLDPFYAKYLVHNYGKHSDRILSDIGSDASEASLMKAEIRYAVRNEMTHKLDDFLIRRTGRLFFDRPKLELLADFAVEEFAKSFQWNSQQLWDARAGLQRTLASVTDFH